MLGKGDPLFFMHQELTQGDGYMLIAAFVYASYCVLLKRWKMPISSWVVIYIQGLFAVAMLSATLAYQRTAFTTATSDPINSLRRGGRFDFSTLDVGESD